MRRLYFVPIIHLGADMGSLGPALDEKARAEFGSDFWQQHQDTVAAFWDSIGRFFADLNPSGFKVYQDGLAAGGPDGLKIIQEGARQGSQNFNIVAGMLERGAVLVKTEDLDLIKREQVHVAQIARSSRLDPKEARAIRHAQSQLIARRDDFIARSIRETLAAQETGVLFIGAYHDVLPRLPRDIRVVQVKDPAKVREYYRTLAAGTAQSHRQRLHQLAVYLTSPISAPVG